MRNERRAAHAPVAFGLKEAQERFADFVAAHFHVRALTGRRQLSFCVVLRHVFPMML